MNERAPRLLRLLLPTCTWTAVLLLFVAVAAACSDSMEATHTPEIASSPASESTSDPAPEPTRTPTPTLVTELAPVSTPTSSPEPTPAVLGDCRDGMRLQHGEGCRYTGGDSPQANVVLSVQHDGTICREGGPAKQEVGGVTINVDSLRLCVSGGFERDDAFQSEIAASANADGSWTFYESRLSASDATTPRPEITPEAAVSPTARPRPTAIPALESLQNVFESGESIPDFPSDRAYAGNFRNGVQLTIAGGNVVIQMSNGGVVEYSHATYRCVDTVSANSKLTQ